MEKWKAFCLFLGGWLALVLIEKKPHLVDLILSTQHIFISRLAVGKDSPTNPIDRNRGFC